MHKYFVKFVNFVVKNLYFQWSFAYFLYKLPRKRDIENLSLCLVFHFFFTYYFCPVFYVLKLCYLVLKMSGSLYGISFLSRIFDPEGLAILVSLRYHQAVNTL